MQRRVWICSIDDIQRFRYKPCKELVSEGKLKLRYCKNEDQVVDLLTKWVTIEVFKSSKKHASMEDLEDLNYGGVLWKKV